MPTNDPTSNYTDAELEALFEKFYEIIRTIPTGKVASYGQIAQIADHSRDARLVGQALSQSEGKGIPWHRVVSASGKIAMPTRQDLRERQQDLLLEEGVEFIADYQVDMRRFDWQANQPQLDLF
ncbi:MAG: MGMT family protein [Kangiellaceae bacterium]|nr:MGMT family protein [Kangiellaceae bacterium]